MRLSLSQARKRKGVVKCLIANVQCAIKPVRPLREPAVIK